MQNVPRSVDFYELYQAMSEHLMEQYVDRYDWVSWPDQDEFLEGPDRAAPTGMARRGGASPYDWIQFNNFNFWWTSGRRPRVPSGGRTGPPLQPFSGLRAPHPVVAGLGHQHQGVQPQPPAGERYPRLFNLRHYPMRSEAQMAGAWRWTGPGCAGAGAITTTTT